MRSFVLVIMVSMFSTSAIAAPVDCGTKGGVDYQAKIDGVGNGRSLSVGFIRNPGRKEAYRVLTACMEVAVRKDSSHELLGSAWVGDEQVKLMPGHELLVYLPKEGKVRPYSYHEASQSLIRGRESGR